MYNVCIYSLHSNKTTTMEASLKRRFQHMHPDHLIPLAVRSPPPPSSPDHHHLLPKRRLDDFPAATSQPLHHDHHHHHVYAGGQRIMKPNQYPNLQVTMSSSHHHRFDSSSIFYPNSIFTSSTPTSFNVPLHGDSTTPPPIASLTDPYSTPLVTPPPVFASRSWAAPAPVLAFPYILPAGHVVGGGGGTTATTSLPPLVELCNQKEQVGAPDDKARARKAVNEKNLQRRRRIREKFSSLEKLVPATRRRLNKAAMLEEACKYIKFLEAQVKALESMRRAPAFGAGGGGHPGSLAAAAAVPARVLEELSQERVLEMMVNSEKTQAVLSEKGWCVVSLEQAEVLKSALQSLLLKQKLMASAQTMQHLHLGHHQPY